MADEPFTWGAGGARLTPDEIAQRRKDAALLVQQGTNVQFAPGTRGAGAWTQGLAHVAKALEGGFESRQADQAAKANADDNKQMIAALLGGGASAPAATAAVVADDTPRGIRNNNPLNIEDGPFAKSQPGYAGTDGRFAKFETPDHGTAAASSLLDSYNKRGLNTVAGIVNRWAPAGDGNNVSAYATDVSGRLGVDPNAPLTPTQRPALIAAMAQHENGRPVPVPGAPVVAADDGEDTPVAKVAQAMPGAAPAPVAKVATGLGAVNPAVLQAMTSPYADDATKKIAGLLMQQQMTPKDVHTQVKDADGNLFDVNRATGERKVLLQPKDTNPTSVKEYEYYTKNLPSGQAPMPYDQWSTAKSRAAATNVTTNVDMNSGQTYDKQLAEGLGKAHASLANGVEDAQSRARDVAAMQGAVDQIQKNNGTTGGMAPEQRLALQKSINAGLNAIGIEKPFSEADISDKEFLTKFNRSMAGAQAKNAVGSRVTNFEMSNYLKANPGLDMTVTGNQRLLGIQAQIEQRNIAVGNAIRDATAAAISSGKKIDPVTVQKIVTSYDEEHHIKDPVSGQDLTQSYALPEFQQGGTNPGLATQHETNVGKMRRYNPATGQIE